MAKKDKPFNYTTASDGELSHRLDQTTEQLFKLRFRAASAPIKDTNQIRTLRREVARIYTFINQRKNEDVQQPKAAEPKAAAAKAAVAEKAAPKKAAAAVAEAPAKKARGKSKEK
ncbi:MAG: 50S ribosomal protein L29 [Elusimicrobia bacterium]|nr:50S ribosomal protein L29 [Elusimicrobiota bacterium]